LIECEADLDALERALLVAAIHAEAVAGERAWLARWGERRGWLEGWGTLEPGSEGASLARAIARARRAAPDQKNEAPPVCARGWRRRTLGRARSPTGGAAGRP